MVWDAPFNYGIDLAKKMCLCDPASRVRFLFQRSIHGPDENDGTGQTLHILERPRGKSGCRQSDFSIRHRGRQTSCALRGPQRSAVQGSIGTA